MESKKIREVIREEKMEKKKVRKEVNVELFMLSRKNDTHKHSSCIIPLDKKPMAAANYSLGGISSLILVLSLVRSSFVS